MSQKIMGVTVGTPHRPDAVSKKIGPFLVTVAQNEDGSYAVDKTYGELVEAKSAGRTLRCRYYDDDVYLPFTAYHGVFTFSAVIDNTLYQIDITAAGQSQEAQAKVTTTPLSSGGGSDGITPHIGANGNWWIGEEDTGVSAGVTDEQISGAVEEYMNDNLLVKTVNGTAPDENGNVEIESPSGTAAASVEPAEDDIPKVFFGGALQQTKDEAVVPFRYISKTEDISGYAEIKAQGNSSMSYPKKNQTVKLFADADCTGKLKVNFKGWGKQNKHCYKANWIDLTHARNIVSARLWGDIVKTRANYAELPEQLRTSPNQGAVDGFPVKVYAAGVYQGRYTINIPKDKWMANMDDELDTHCILCGEGYVSGCFREASVSQWTDEIHDTMPDAIKTRWIEVIDFVMNSTDEVFVANLGNYFDIPSLIDYLLFGLLSCGLDAYGKNQLYFTYDGQKWIAEMYDMDATWGLWWNGHSFVATDYDRSEYQDFKDGNGNLLYIRLEQLFPEELQSRWAELKSGVLSIENIINRFERFTDITPAELVREDYATTTGQGAFTGIPSALTNTVAQIRNFVVARQMWCDSYIAKLSPGIDIPCTSIKLSSAELTFTESATQILTATVEPTDTTDTVVWSTSDDTIARVSDGVVTPVGAGECIITATAGDVAAQCRIVVEQIDYSLVWSDSPAYQLDDSGNVVSGDCYVSELFQVGYGKCQVANNNTSRVYVSLALYDADGNFIKGKNIVIQGGQTFSYVDIEDFSNVKQARLAVHFYDNGTLDAVVFDAGIGLWSAHAAYSINGGTPVSGADFVTLRKIPVIAGKTYALQNRDGGAFKWKLIAQYTADGSFISQVQDNGVTDAIESTMDANAAFVYLTAAKGTDPDTYLEFAVVE